MVCRALLLPSCSLKLLGLLQNSSHCFTSSSSPHVGDGFLLAVCRATVRFSLPDSSLWLEVKPSLACCFQECVACVSACHAGGFYFTSLEWNGSHPAGLGECINRGTHKPALGIQNTSQASLCATLSCFD